MTPSFSKHAELQIRLLGDVEVSLDAAAVPLPPSKRARALLAYLVTTGRPQRREHLCDLLWTAPDDPRASLRWSLSHLRRVLNHDGVIRLGADRTHVVFDAKGATVDVGILQTACAKPLLPMDAARLVSWLGGDFLAGLDLPDLLAFSSWQAAVRDECRRHATKILATALEDELEPDSAVALARRLVELQPRNPRVHATLIRLLGRTGRTAEAEQRFRVAEQRFSSCASYPIVTEAWREAGATGWPLPRGGDDELSERLDSMHHGLGLLKLAGENR